jgi:hypothetical protein
MTVHEVEHFDQVSVSLRQEHQVDLRPVVEARNSRRMRILLVATVVALEAGWVIGVVAALAWVWRLR